MEHEKFVTGIGKTGFVLEYKVSQLLREHGWAVINNKYYVDDLQETVREIDIVAYKAKEVRDVSVYTTLIISCKKNEKDAWVLLSKERDPDDPNVDWHPVHVWCNQEAISFMLKDGAWRNDYIKELSLSECAELSEPPNRHIFAFQQMSRASGVPNNDRDIFDSITGLMKAQAYELNALPKRKREPVVYQFNLISLVDTDLLRLDFDGANTSATNIETETYVTNYIINKRQTSARIHFIRWHSFDKILTLYDKLHKGNLKYFDALCDRFFEHVFSYQDRIEVFFKDFSFLLDGYIWSSIQDYGYDLEDKPKMLLSWDEDSTQLLIGLRVDKLLLDPKESEKLRQSIEALNSNERLKTEVTKNLELYYRYSGSYRFELIDDLPF